MEPSGLRPMFPPGPLLILAPLVGGPAIATLDSPDAIRFECGQVPHDWIDEYRQAVRSGAIRRPDPADARARAARSARSDRSASAPTSTGLTREHLFLYEDRDKLFKTTLTHAQRLAIMVDAANHLIAEHGDHFDFIGFFLSFKALNPLGAAFYQPIFNDVAGIGDPLNDGSQVFDTRRVLGLASHHVQGFLMMWGVKQWEGGTSTSLATSTRLAINHEFGHRFACYLPPLADGRALEGTIPCGTSGHWNGQVDAQASCLLIGEWAGSNPAVRSFPGGWFNQDIPGGVFSWFELYLMGYATAGELDTAPSELRFVAEPACTSPSYAPITTFSSADVIATAGPRRPHAAHAQKDFRCAWIMIHLPDKPPTDEQLGIAVSVLQQQPIDWRTSTLGRGTMSHALFPDDDGDGVPDRRTDGDRLTCATASDAGCAPVLSADTTTNGDAPPPELVVTSLPSGSAGFLLLGGPPHATGSAGAGLCVGPPYVRAGWQVAGGEGSCGGTLAFDLGRWLSDSGARSFVPGATVHAQFGYLDRASAAVRLTDGVRFVVDP